MHEELRALYEADQAERKQILMAGTPEYGGMRERDAQRRQRVTELIAAGALEDAEDYFHAAMIFQHGDTIEETWQAHTLALQAAELGSKPGTWLAAASLDRWLMRQGKPQKYGTQFVSDGTRWRLWDVDPATTDTERAEWNVPTIEQQLKRAEEMTQQWPPQPVTGEAPSWLKEAVKRWAKEERG